MVVLLGYCRAVLPPLVLVPLRPASADPAEAAAAKTAARRLSVGRRREAPGPAQTTEDAGEIRVPV